MESEADWRAKAAAMSDDEIRNALPHMNERKRAAYLDVLNRRSEAKADDLRNREVGAAVSQANTAKRAYDLSKWAIAISVLALLVAVIGVVKG